MKIGGKTTGKKILERLEHVWGSNYSNSANKMDCTPRRKLISTLTSKVIAANTGSKNDEPFCHPILFKIDSFNQVLLRNKTKEYIKKINALTNLKLSSVCLSIITSCIMLLDHYRNLTCSWWLLVQPSGRLLAMTPTPTNQVILHRTRRVFTIWKNWVTLFLYNI